MGKRELGGEESGIVGSSDMLVISAFEFCFVSGRRTVMFADPTSDLRYATALKG